MKALLQEALGHVECLDALVLAQCARREDHLVHAGAVVGDIEGPGQPATDPVRVEHGPFGYPAQAVGAVHLDVGERPGEHQGVAVPAVDATDRAWRGDPAEAIAALVVQPGGLGPGRKSTKRSETATGPAPGPPPPWGWRRSCAGSCGRCRSPCRPGVRPQDGIQVRPVVVEEPANLVDRLGDLGDVLFEQPRVFGLVSMMPATSVSSTLRSAAMSTQPRSSLGTVVTS